MFDLKTLSSALPGRSKCFPMYLEMIRKKSHGAWQRTDRSMHNRSSLCKVDWNSTGCSGCVFPFYWTILPVSEFPFQDVEFRMSFITFRLMKILLRANFWALCMQFTCLPLVWLLQGLCLVYGAWWFWINWARNVRRNMKLTKWLYQHPFNIRFPDYLEKII